MFSIGSTTNKKRRIKNQNQNPKMFSIGSAFNKKRRKIKNQFRMVIIRNHGFNHFVGKVAMAFCFCC